MPKPLTVLMPSTVGWSLCLLADERLRKLLIMTSRRRSKNLLVGHVGDHFHKRLWVLTEVLDIERRRWPSSPGSRRRACVIMIFFEDAVLVACQQRVPSPLAA
jgi:hypothetical protein